MKRALTILAPLVALPLSSCLAVVAAGAAGVGIVQYQKNETSRAFRQGVEETWVATLEAMDQLGYGPPLTKSLDPMEAYGEFADAADTIYLRVEAVAEGGTRLVVRVGRFNTKNHRRKALVILEEASSILDGDAELRAWSQKVRELENNGEGDHAVPADEDTENR